MKKYIVKLTVRGEETIMSGSPLSLATVIEKSLGKNDKNDYRIVQARVIEKNTAGDLMVHMLNENEDVSEVYELIAPLQIVGTLSDHDNVLETLAKLAFLKDLDHDRLVQIMEYPVEEGKVIKEDTLFNMFKWCGERIEAQMCAPVKRKHDGENEVPFNA